MQEDPSNLGADPRLQTDPFGPRPLPKPHPRGPDHSATGRVIWVCLFLLSLLAMRFGVPFMAEEISHAVTRGRQRAEYEVAGQYLNEVSFDSLSKAYQMVSQRVAPSVVHINVTRPQVKIHEEGASLVRPFGKLQDQGSGVIMDEQGYVLTNRHVVQGGTSIVVTLSDGRHVPGELVGADQLTDLAVLKIPGEKLIAAHWGNSDDLQVGALVWAAGSPFGLQSTVTSGILSAKNRAGMAGTPYQDFLQTDAAVNPGNSGGPLVDSQGRVVGINTAIIGESYQGISFAVPSTIARQVYERLRTAGRVDRGFLGVQMAEIDDDLAEHMELETDRGAAVTDVVAGSPAALAGVEPGDVIVSWNGQVVDSPTAVSRLVASTAIGSQAQLTVLRDNRPLELRVIVGKRPAES